MRDLIQDHIREKGELHHYQLDQACHGLVYLFPDHKEVHTLRLNLKALPSKAEVRDHAHKVRKILFSKQKEMNHLDYANIYYLIAHTLQLVED